ncbi:dipeptide/oligopeptide/nickel ABC transporter ATP-binding protein [Nocardia sp. NBC_01503]|uniref:ABC transporter ATP-binding protein n=1 Tax=Nocardia sp. NBC_01503 TaxID=2975997 RepID=UPI002E7BB849|nr:dipeptide/oligopeptide/nickel ABC transporter ATP-binding protein [Nocardia sp. NBC_01503]WTL31519.1 dipeptide/oligopeptide/nickel ABC transporter ATP-binding protein [Nocardia sp. NBC_01503]
MSLLEIEDLTVRFPGRGWRAAPFTAVDGVNLDIRRGETVGLVGESGSGKTTVGRAVLGLTPVAGGTIRFDGAEIQQLSREQRRPLAARIQVVFQDPYSSLNPTMSVSDILTEPLRAAGIPRVQARARVTALLDQVGLPDDAADRYAREFSGGQRQRVAIARALALDPELVICDEAVSALDLSTRDRILALLIEIQERTGVAYLFVAHDIAVVRHISHRVAVMQQGRVLEFGSCAQVTSEPAHRFTGELLRSSLVADPERQRERRARR